MPIIIINSCNILTTKKTIKNKFAFNTLVNKSYLVATTRECFFCSKFSDVNIENRKLGWKSMWINKSKVFTLRERYFVLSRQTKFEKKIRWRNNTIIETTITSSFDKNSKFSNRLKVDSNKKKEIYGISKRAGFHQNHFTKSRICEIKID